MLTDAQDLNPGDVFMFRGQGYVVLTSHYDRNDTRITLIAMPAILIDLPARSVATIITLRTAQYEVRIRIGMVNNVISVSPDEFTTDQKARMADILIQESAIPVGEYYR